MRLFGFGTRKERTLANLKQRAKVGTTLTLVINQLNGTDRPWPDPVLGLARRIVSVAPDCLFFDPSEPGDANKRIFHWPQEPQEGFSGMILSPNGTLAGFLDDDTFVVDYAIYYSVFRLAT